MVDGYSIQTLNKSNKFKANHIILQVKTVEINKGHSYPVQL